MKLVAGRAATPVPLLWDYSVLNRVIRVFLKDSSGLDPAHPGVRRGLVRPYLEIDLRRYPMVDHQDSLDALVDELKAKSFRTRTLFRHKQL